MLSSPSEGTANAVLEAMAAGLAVAGTDNPGMRGAVGPAAAMTAIIARARAPGAIDR